MPLRGNTLYQLAKNYNKLKESPVVAHTRIHTHTHTRTHTYIHMHTHTHTRTYTNQRIPIDRWQMVNI